MNFVNKSFTSWQMAWKIVFNICTLLMMFAPSTRKGGGGYFYHLRQVPLKNWTDLQCWLGALLVMLVIFNDPLFVIEVFSKEGVYLAALYIVFLGAFLATMMFFWLCVVHEASLQVSTSEASHERSEPRAKRATSEASHERSEPRAKRATSEASQP